MIRHDRLPARLRLGAAALTLTIALGAAGCGGSSGGSKKDYYSAINSFCTDIKGAAGQVQTDATNLQKGIGNDPQKAIKGFAGTLDRFANTTQKALDRFKQAKVPGDFKSFNDNSITAFSGVVAKLHKAANGARTGNVQALSGLGTDLNSVRLPNLPKDVSSNAKACAAISG